MTISKLQLHLPGASELTGTILFKLNQLDPWTTDPTKQISAVHNFALQVKKFVTRVKDKPRPDDKILQL